MSYKRAVIDMAYSRGCITRDEVIREFYEMFREEFEGRSRRSLESKVDSVLRGLVKRGILIKMYKGVYCRPEYKIKTCDEVLAETLRRLIEHHKDREKHILDLAVEARQALLTGNTKLAEDKLSALVGFLSIG
jgi:hypothetical protein